MRSFMQTLDRLVNFVAVFACGSMNFSEKEKTKLQNKFTDFSDILKEKIRLKFSRRKQLGRLAYFKNFSRTPLGL